MIGEGTRNPMIQPTRSHFATVMNGWVLTKAPVATKKVHQLLSTMKELSHKGWKKVAPTIVHYNILLNALAQNGDAARAEQLLQELIDGINDDFSYSDNVLPDQVSFTTVLHALSKSNDRQAGSKAERILRQIQELNQDGMLDVKRNILMYTTVIQCYAKVGDGEKALALLRTLEEGSIQEPDLRPDTACYNVCLAALCNSNHPEDADALLHEMFFHGLANERSFNTMLAACARSGDAHRAERILNRVNELAKKDPKITPSVITYNNVLNAWSKSNDPKRFKRTLEILNHMVDLYKAGDKELLPTSASWNTVLNSIAQSKGRQKLAERTLEQFQEAWNAGLVSEPPNVRSWNTVLSACAKNYDMNRAIRLFDSMLETPCKPDIVTYNTVLNSMSRIRKNHEKAVNEADRIFELLKDDKRVRPTRVTFLTLLNCYLNAGDVVKAEDVLDDMVERGSIKPDRGLCNIFLQGLVNISKPKEAEAFLLKMIMWFEEGLDTNPKVDSYNRVLNAWARSRKQQSGERANYILRQMESNGEVDIISYNTTVNAWKNSGDLTALNRIHDLVFEMVLKGKPHLAPTIETYGTWLKAIELYDKEQRKQHLKNLEKILEIQGFVIEDEHLNGIFQQLKASAS